MALQSRMHLARPRGVRPGCRVCPMGAPRTPAPARAKQQAPGGVPGTWNRPPDRGYSAAPWFNFKEPRRCGGISSANARGNRPQGISKSRRELVETPCRACVPCVFEAVRQQNFKNSSVWRPARPKRSGNVGVGHVLTKQNDYGGSWCQNSSLKFWPPGTELCSTCGTRASLVHHFARPDRVLTPICVLNSS